jgi:hypothetical protein
MLALAAACAACGDDAGAVDAGAGCAANFTGAYADYASSPATCAMLSTDSASGDQLLEFSIDSHTLGAEVMIEIDLGAAPATGPYTSETLGTWHAVEADSRADGGCVYSAGSEVVPNGNFALTLTALDTATAHGTLDVLQYVHALEGTDCGANDNESIHVAF